MRVRMLETRSGTEDGYTIHRYQAGEEYDLADSLARAFLAAGFAVTPARKKEEKASSGNKKKRKETKKRAGAFKGVKKAAGGKRRILRLIKE